ncbi:MAG: DNA-processing protein DprA [Candidatus Omnitrophota bacterium]
MSAFDEADRHALLVLNHPYLTGRWVYPFFQEGIPPSGVLSRIQAEDLAGKRAALEACLKIFDPGLEMEKCRSLGCRPVFLFDQDFPLLLKEIADPPLVLYVLGEILGSDTAAVAIVGARHASFYGLRHARVFSHELAQAGITVVSGLAKGIDQAAHEGALEVPYGRTLAVLGSGIDRCYPRENEALARRLSERGAVITEYPLGTDPLARNFPRRNRIIAGLALGVVVIEAHSRSGSLITAREAAEQGREVFALPGPVDQFTSRGTNRLIKEGAALAESSEDILFALAQGVRSLIHRPKSSEENLNAETGSGIPAGEGPSSPGPEGEFAEAKVLSSEIRGLEKEPSDFEGILERSGYSAGKLAGLLIEWELQGKIRRRKDGKYELC